MRVLLPGLALFAATLSLTAQTPSPSASGTAPVSSAADTQPAAMSTFHSDALHLSYSYPAGYTDASAMVGPAFEASVGHEAGAKDTLRCVTLPFSAMSSATGLSMVLLVRADAGCMKKNFTGAQLTEFTRGEVQGLAASGAHTQFGEPVSFTTQGHPAELLLGTFELPTGQPLHALVVCVLLKPDVGCWQFLASSAESLRAMSAFPLTLEGGQAAPLVPASALPKP